MSLGAPPGPPAQLQSTAESAPIDLSQSSSAGTSASVALSTRGPSVIQWTAMSIPRGPRSSRPAAGRRGTRTAPAMRGARARLGRSAPLALLLVSVGTSLGAAAQPSPAPRPSAGCGRAPPAEPGAKKLVKIDVFEPSLRGTHERQFLLRLPASYDRNEPLPMVLDIHGYTSDSATQSAKSGFAVRPMGSQNLPPPLCAFAAAPQRPPISFCHDADCGFMIKRIPCGLGVT